MDRDQRWDRVERGYDAIVHGVGEHAPNATAAIEAGYERGENDEFLLPTVIDGVDGIVRSGDAGHPCQLPGRPGAPADPRACGTRSSTASTGPRRTAGRPRPDLLVVTLTEYEAGLPVEVAFPPEQARSLAETFSEAGWRQFHVAETEKYAHVTYFFNGGIEAPWPGEDRRLIPSPKVATYDLAARHERARRHRRAGRGHRVGASTTSSSPTTPTRTWSATRGSGRRRSAALEVLDGCLGRVVAAIEAVEAPTRPGPAPLLAITADHGNADQLRDAEGRPVTAHSLNPVPFLLIGRAAARAPARATASWPTWRRPCWSSPGLPPWEGMTGRSRILC